MCMAPVDVTPHRHADHVPRSPTWTDQDLIDAVDVSINIKQVCDRLGLRPGGGTYRTLERHMARLELETLHLDRRIPDGQRSRLSWTDDDLVAAVRDSNSISEVSRRLGYTTSGGILRFITGHVRRLELDISHFAGQSWAKGKSSLAEDCDRSRRFSSSTRHIWTRAISDAASSPSA